MMLKFYAVILWVDKQTYRIDPIGQQQFAWTVVLTSPQPWHTTSVSLQLSMQQGIQNRVPAVSRPRKQHQAMVTDPTLVLITLSVYLWHI